jgi:hypothetical protein
VLPQGTIVSGYRVDGVLGEGGMGVVYRATQLSLNRTVALKILAAELSEDGAFRERFRREGLLQAAIDHEHIVTVYEAGDTEHGLFLAMRLIRGPTLKDMILAGEVGPERALLILAQVAQALDTAHDVGLTHRDIKPQNILIGARDHAYLADFGLTQSSDEASLTETGQFIGTIDYVAPEQIQGQAATARSDVYSLTAVLYESLTGAVPFARPNEAAVLYAHISEPPPRVTERRSELPARIDEVVTRGMAKAPADRYASAGELIADAGAAFGGEQVAATALRPHSSPPTAGPTEIVPAGERTVTRRARPAPGAATTMRAGTPAAATAPAGAARPAGAPTTPAATPPAERRPGLRGGALALIAVLGVAAAAGGYAIGSGGGDSEEPSEPFTSSASAGTLGLSFPASWKRVDGAPGIPGMRFEDPIVLEPQGQRRTRLVAGQVAASGPSLLPAQFLGRLPGGAPDGEPVRLSRLEALRYQGLAARGADGRLQLYTVPTDRGVATVACSAPAGAAGDDFRRDCEGVATTLELAGASSYPLGASPVYARRLRAVLGNLGRARRAGAARLREADTPDAQAAAADALASAHLRAARAMENMQVSPADAAAHRALSHALEGTALAYERAAGAARAGENGVYSAAGRALDTEQEELRRALSGLERLGYVLP